MSVYKQLKLYFLHLLEINKWHHSIFTKCH